MLKLFTEFENVKKEWEKISVPYFLQINFLEIYYKTHPQIKHFFVIDTNTRLYANIFKLTLNKTKNYLDNSLFFTIFLRFLNFDVLYLTNSFITNVPAFISDKNINLKYFLNQIQDNYSLIIIPDFLFNNIITEENTFTKIEAESEMILDIRKEWTELKNYTTDLKMKYRNKVKNIMKKTHDLQIKNLDVNDLDLYSMEIQKLFNQVVTESRFKGPNFNTNSFSLFVEQGFMKVNGYFLNSSLVGFSSEIQDSKILYSYFVGFDKNLNKSIPIYGRILIENISRAIKMKKDCLIFGRTANEFKSNFGAYPKKSFIYLKVKNKLLSFILKPIYSRLFVKKWTQRSPFKNK